MLVCRTYPPVLGGSEIEAQRVSDELQQRGYRPRIVSGGGDPMPAVSEWVDPCGLRVRLYGHKGSERKRDLIYALGVAWTLFKERRNYDVVYFLMQGVHLATGVPVARLLGKPIVMKFSCSSLVLAMRESWVGRLELSFLRRWATRILVLNPGMVEEALEVGIDKARLGWMPNPVDTEYFRPCSPQERLQHRQVLGIGPDTPLVVFVGRLDHQKKLPWMLGAFARVARQRPAAKLVLIGDGPLRADVEALVAKLHCEPNVILTGRLDKSGVLRWLQAADVFTMVSEIEGLPCSLIEAMAVGVTPVLSDIPAHSQLVENEVHGLLTALGDEESIATGLLRALDDSALRQRLGATARQRMVEEFSTARVIDCYENLFDECLAAAGVNPV
jgi:glycosyltransferase involved in cell wall biosynthesis